MSFRRKDSSLSENCGFGSLAVASNVVGERPSSVAAGDLIRSDTASVISWTRSTITPSIPIRCCMYTASATLLQENTELISNLPISPVTKAARGRGRCLLQLAIGQEGELGLLDLGDGRWVLEYGFNLRDDSLQATFQAQLCSLLQGIPPRVVVHLRATVCQEEDLEVPESLKKHVLQPKTLKFTTKGRMNAYRVCALQFTNKQCSIGLERREDYRPAMCVIENHLQVPGRTDQESEQSIDSRDCFGCVTVRESVPLGWTG